MHLYRQPERRGGAARNRQHARRAPAPLMGPLCPRLLACVWLQDEALGPCPCTAQQARQAAHRRRQQWREQRAVAPLPGQHMAGCPLGRLPHALDCRQTTAGASPHARQPATAAALPVGAPAQDHRPRAGTTYPPTCDDACASLAGVGQPRVDAVLLVPPRAAQAAVAAAVGGQAVARHLTAVHAQGFQAAAQRGAHAAAGKKATSGQGRLEGVRGGARVGHLGWASGGGGLPGVPPCISPRARLCVNPVRTPRRRHTAS